MPAMVLWAEFLYPQFNMHYHKNYMVKPPRKEVSVLLFTIVNILKIQS